MGCSSRFSFVAIRSFQPRAAQNPYTETDDPHGEQLKRHAGKAGRDCASQAQEYDTKSAAPAFTDSCVIIQQPLPTINGKLDTREKCRWAKAGEELPMAA